MSTLTRDETIKRIRAGLRRRSGKDWSVSGGRGTAYGWINVEAPPRRRVNTYHTSVQDAAELAGLLDLERVEDQGVSIPASSDYYAEYVDRAEGRTPTVRGHRYWD